MKVRITFEVSNTERRNLAASRGRETMSHDDMKWWALTLIESVLDDYANVDDEDDDA